MCERSPLTQRLEAICIHVREESSLRSLTDIWILTPALFQRTGLSSIITAGSAMSTAETQPPNHPPDPLQWGRHL